MYLLFFDINQYNQSNKSIYPKKQYFYAYIKPANTITASKNLLPFVGCFHVIPKKIPYDPEPMDGPNPPVGGCAPGVVRKPGGERTRNKTTRRLPLPQSLPRNLRAASSLGGGNSKIFGMFTPKIGEDFHPFWRAYFSEGLVETTNLVTQNITGRNC